MIGRLLDEFNAAYEAANGGEVTLTPGLRKVIHELLGSGGREGVRVD